MNFLVKKSYNLDLLNFFNVITGDEFYTKYHLEAYLSFKDLLSDESNYAIKALVEANESSMLGPMLCLVFSSLPGFDTMKLQELTNKKEILKDSFSKTVYYDEKEWEKQEGAIDIVLSIITELEEKGFYEYWVRERLPLIDRSRVELEEYLSRYNINEDIENMLGNRGIDEITVYLASFASPHGMKICGNNFISDVTFPKETTLLVAIHEMFHPPYNANNILEELKLIGEEAFFRHAFETKNPQYGYAEINGFIEENVVEAMSLIIGEKIGIVEDPIEYLKKHDDGSHVFSVILMKYFKLYRKPKDKSFEEYFKELIRKLPFGQFEAEYRDIIAKGMK